MPNTITKDLGPVSGYAIAVERGYTGTEEEWIAEVLRGTQNAQTATKKAAEAAASESAAAGSADDASDSADSAKADALKAEGNAVGKQNDVDVVDGPYYHNNAKYYAEQAEASKRAAASSETAAGTAAAAAQEWATGGTSGTPSETNNAKAYAEAAEAALEAIPEDYSTLAAQVQSLFPQIDATGNPITINDGATEMPVVKLDVNLSPVQAAGTPTPENPIPITGRSEITVKRTGKNIWGGQQMLDDMAVAITGSNVVVNQEAGTIYYLPSYASNKTVVQGIFKPNTRYSIIITFQTTNTSGHTNMAVYYTDGTNDRLSWSGIPANTKVTKKFYTDSGKTVSRIGGYNLSGNDTVYTKESGIFEGDVAIEEYEPYTGQKKTFDFSATAGTVYGGTLNALTGELNVTWGSIASYTGDEPVDLTAVRWLSSMDTYLEGGTPTVGAQVVYELETPQAYSYTGLEFTTALGVNNFSAADGWDGTISLTYRGDPAISSGAQLRTVIRQAGALLETVLGAGTYTSDISAAMATLVRIMKEV